MFRRKKPSTSVGTPVPPSTEDLTGICTQAVHEGDQDKLTPALKQLYAGLQATSPDYARETYALKLMTCVWSAVSGDNPESLNCIPTLAAELKTLGLNVDQRVGGRQQNPLHHATLSGNTEAVKALIDAGAKPAYQHQEATPCVSHLGFPRFTSGTQEIQWNALHVAPTAEIVDILITAGADVISPDCTYSPLHTARNKAVAQTLIDSYANVNDMRLRGVTPLHCAAQQGKEDVADTLLSQPSITPNIQITGPFSPSGDVPSKIAQQHGHWSLTKTLRAAEQTASRGAGMVQER